MEKLAVALVHLVMTMIVFAVFWYVLFQLDPNDVSVNIELHDMFLGLFYLFVAFVVAEIVWILFAIRTPGFWVKLTYLASITLLVATIIFDLAFLCRLNGLFVDGAPIAVEPVTALHFALSIFAGAGVERYAAAPSLDGPISTVAILSYLLIPIVISVLFAIITDQPTGKAV